MGLQFACKYSAALLWQVSDSQERRGQPMATERNRLYTMEEYLALERESEVKYKYWNGEIFAMSGGTLAYDQITGNVFDLLRAQLRGRDCRVFTNNMQIKVPAALPYR